MKRYILTAIFSLVLAIVVFPSSALALSNYTVNFESQGAVGYRDNGEFYSCEYAVITGVDSKGKTVWQHTTGQYDMAQLERVQEIGTYQKTYLYNESGVITALDVETGAVKWRNKDFGGGQISYYIDDDGTLYICGYLGPDFCAIDANGKTLCRIESFNRNYCWASAIKKESKDIVCVGLEGPRMGTHFYVNLKDFSYSGSISELVVDDFHDVLKGSWYADSVHWAVGELITTGTSPTTFSPEDTCTTAQILTFLWRVNNSPNPSISNPFSDVKTSDWYYKPALWAYQTGLISGTVFNGKNPCTRAATVTYLWKLAGQPAQNGKAFSDVPSGAVYEQAVSWAVAQNITTGTSATTFAPNQTCTRGQIVTFLNRFETVQKLNPNSGSGSANPSDLYRNVLNTYYEQIRTGWPNRDRLDVSYMFYSEYSKCTLSEIGYALTDLNGDNIPELLISPVSEATRDGIILEMYSIVNNKVVHLFSGGERYRYYLTEGNTIYYEWSGGASFYGFNKYRVSGSSEKLDMVYTIIFDDDVDEDNAFWGTSWPKETGRGHDYSGMKKIPHAEAYAMEPTKKPFEVKTFANYT